MLDRCSFQICTCRSETTDQPGVADVWWNQYFSTFLDAANCESQHNPNGEGKNQISNQIRSQSQIAKNMLFAQCYFNKKFIFLLEKNHSKKRSQQVWDQNCSLENEYHWVATDTIFYSRLGILPSPNCMTYYEIYTGSRLRCHQFFCYLFIWTSTEYRLAVSCLEQPHCWFVYLFPRAKWKNNCLLQSYLIRRSPCPTVKTGAELYPTLISLARVTDLSATICGLSKALRLTSLGH